MKKNIQLSNARLASALTILSAGMLSGIGSAQAVDLKPLQNTRFDFGSAGNLISVNNVFDFTNSATNPPETSPGTPGTIEITNAQPGFFELLSGGTNSVSGATAEVSDIAFGFPLDNGVFYNIPRIEGFYDNFKDVTGKDVNIRFDVTGFEVRFNTIADVVNSVTFNLDGFIVDKDGENSLPPETIGSRNEIPVVFNFTTITGQVPQSPQPAELPYVEVDSEVIIGDIPDLTGVDPIVSTSYSGTVTTSQAAVIPEPMTMLGSAAAISFGYFSKKRRSSK